MAKIIILGSGGFGLSIAIMCANAGHDVTVWSKFRDEIEAIERTGELKAKLPGCKVPKSVKLTTDISDAKGKELVILGIPTAFCRSVCEEAVQFIDPESVVVNTAKGLENGTLKTMSVVTKESMPNNRVAILTGPSHAEELARGIPTTVTVASDDIEVSRYVQQTLTSANFRIYSNTDVLGCELGGSLKNVIALAAGVCDGLGLGDNTKAALMTRGIREIAAVGEAMGADPATFAGLSGIGDLIVTCCSMHSRNRRAGILIGQGVSPDEAVERVGTVEGYGCTRNAYELSRKLGVEMPITEQLYSILFEGRAASDSIRALMGRPSKNETEKEFLG
ncbi:glycerol-3-phosphate dehydrogenase (NAD(P)+) [Ruminococcus sp. YE71]|uniref:NAD(P)H-dependent glycerol-3-phosphate dehydrogenase n=1 Tax=unclassified Ruminococcus TaxID=2608920 RepID=UPI000891BCDB|nr:MULTISPECIES: NAD(P)H-dependent glycerol-3-phosphate dehydrogenase [unclassified Ruminococcus]SDA20892.1 glycerol-3-phosphate dehydrogenase (NAD(P)+) [Ruminococcus sp. YE78]SFW33424.1 glycerol-3-phosphate dehydrogenase (NAD(P)+) [Ruminococcus sp. YE71]